MPIEIQKLQKENKINVEFTKETVANIRKLLIAMNKNNSILIINDKCLIPEGWLEMFLNDQKKYPNDAIIASVQYYLGKNGEIKEFKEGFKGEKFGIFNHVTNIVFNFALINIDLGGILYPKNFLENYSFYNEDSNNYDDFWQSAYIIMENKILRQSSKIFDFTKYLIKDINYEKYSMNQKKLLERSKLSFLKKFPNFIDTLKKRQRKIIVSITSYPERFNFLPDLMTFIRNQSFHMNKIIIFLYKDDIEYYKQNISDVEIILTDKDLKPHKKYFYPMKLFRDFAIITLDDDFYYSKDTFESLFNAYIENPNIICGRRTHLMTYKKNGEVKGYFQWKLEQKLIKEPSFDLLTTGNGGIIYPPDILNIDDEFLPIINETLTCDDLTLKYFETIKSIPIKWVINNKINGIFRNLSKINSSTLFSINKINNDICINKLNIIINETIIKNLCVPYRGIQTGISLYLFNKIIFITKILL